MTHIRVVLLSQQISLLPPPPPAAALLSPPLPIAASAWTAAHLQITAPIAARGDTRQRRRLAR